MPRVKYSGVIPGTCNLPVRYDITDDGYLGITQMEGERVRGRVLLSPKQLDELVTFVPRKAKRAA